MRVKSTIHFQEDQPQQKQKQKQTNVWWEKIRRGIVVHWGAIWKIFLALVAIADAMACWPIFVEGWISAVSQVKSNQRMSSNNSKSNGHAAFDFFKSDGSDDDDDDERNQDVCSKPEHDEDYVTCATYYVYYDMLGSFSRNVLLWMGPLFSLLCIFEAVRRAQQAREDMLEMAALDNFEKNLSRLYGSTRRLSINNMSSNAYHNDMQDSQQSAVAAASSSSQEETTYEQDDILARKTLRFWTPVLSTLFLWGLLMPWRTITSKNCGSEVDTAVATVWMTRAIEQLSTISSWMVDELTAVAWHLLLPFSFWQPHKIYARVLKLLRWVRYFRFAGPLLRVLFKLNDQFVQIFKTKQQAWKLKAEKTKREMRRSMLFEDIQKIESYAKLSRFWAKVPTWHIFHAAKEELPPDVGGILEDKKRQSAKLKRQLEDLKKQVRKSPKAFPTSEIYDRIADLSREFTSTLGKSLWTANLIPPQTRFSFSWRIIVTCALLSEFSRLCTSYQLYGRVDVSYTTMMVSVLGCDHGRGNILTATGRFTRKIVRKLVKLPKEQLLTTCTTTSIKLHGGKLANILLSFAGLYEMSIDLVCFIDIYVWFFTGELDVQGQVVPKPFFYRCILPGTLVQVLDHPTVPDMLPNIMFYILNAARYVGYSRMIRWIIAIVPAANVLLVDPIKKFLFRPMQDDEWLHYTESMAILPVISGADIRYAMTMSHPNFNDYQAAGGLRRSSSVDQSVHLVNDEKDDQVGPLRSALKKSRTATKSFVPFLEMSENLRREVSSTGLNLSTTGLNLDSYLDLSRLDASSVDEHLESTNTNYRHLRTVESDETFHFD